jgi:hypothetical protein
MQLLVALDGVPRPLASLRAALAAGQVLLHVCGGGASVGVGQRYLAAGLWLCRLWQLVKQRALPCLFVVPIVLMFGASAARAYVVADRLMLFTDADAARPVRAGAGADREPLGPGVTLGCRSNGRDALQDRTPSTSWTIAAAAAGDRYSVARGVLE